jgi:hypothetical protein
MTDQASGIVRPAARVRIDSAPRAVRVALVMLVGSALGPYGLGLLSSRVLASLDPAMPVALATLGVFVGLGLDVRSERGRRVIAFTSIRALITMVVVGAGAYLPGLWGAGLDTPQWFNAALLAICASDDPLAVVAGGITLAFLREPLPHDAGLLALHFAGVTLAIAVVGWLLLARSETGTEQRVFVIAVLLLLGGAAEYLALSALAAGLLAGLFWEAVGGTTRRAVWRDVLYVQHPLIVLILMVAGARLVVTPIVAMIGLPYLVLRLAGSLTGSAVAGRFAPAASANDDVATLWSPGVVGLAFALNASRVAGPDADVLISIVIVGVLGAELIAPLLKRPEARG